MKKTKKINVLTIFIAILCIFGFLSCALLLFNNNSTNKAKTNASLSQQVAQTVDSNQEFKFGRYAFMSEPMDTNIYPHGMRDISFIDIYEDNTGKELFINENGELEEGEEFTYVEDNGNVIVTYAVGTEDEYTATFAIREGKIVLVDNGEDAMEYVYCNDNLFEALKHCDLTQSDYRQLRIQLVNKDNQIDQLNARIAELEAQIDGIQQEEEPLPGGEN